MYSQYNEDDIINSFFNNKMNGFLIDVGAADGIRYSNSRMLIEKFDWNAILIEPNKKNFQKLTNLYHKNDNVKLFNIACSNENKKEVDFYCDLNDEFEQISTINVEQMQGCKNFYKCDFYIQKINTIRLSDIFKDYKIEKVDFLSIDTESHDVDVLKGIDFKKVYIKLICIEHNNGEIINLMIENNFKILCKSDGNIFYENKENR